MPNENYPFRNSVKRCPVCGEKLFYHGTTIKAIENYIQVICGCCNGSWKERRAENSPKPYEITQPYTTL